VLIRSIRARYSMPKREEIATIDASEVQGEGTFVKLKRMTWGQRRDMIDQVKKLDGEEYTDFVSEWLIENIVEWNLVDVDGAILPKPEKVEDFFKLYDEEVNFLIGLYGKSMSGHLLDDKKN